MTEKRFMLENSNLSNARCNILDYGYGYTNQGLCDLLNELSEENLKLRWILRHYNPQDLNLDFDDEKFKEQIELLYSEKEFLE